MLLAIKLDRSIHDAAIHNVCFVHSMFSAAVAEYTLKNTYFVGGVVAADPGGRNVVEETWSQTLLL